MRLDDARVARPAYGRARADVPGALAAGEDEHGHGDGSACTFAHTSAAAPMDAAPIALAADLVNSGIPICGASPSHGDASTLAKGRPSPGSGSAVLSAEPEPRPRSQPRTGETPACAHARAQTQQPEVSPTSAASYDDALSRARASHARELAALQAALAGALRRAAELEEREEARVEEAREDAHELAASTPGREEVRACAFAARAAAAAARPPTADADAQTLALVTAVAVVQTDDVAVLDAQEAVGVSVCDAETQACGQSPSQQLLVEHARAEIVRLRAVNERLLDAKVRARRLVRAIATRVRRYACKHT